MSDIAQLPEVTAKRDPLPPAPATGNSYVQRAIDVTIALGQGSFGDAGGSNTVLLQGLRVACTIKTTTAPGFGRSTLRIYGVQQNVMNQVSTLGVSPLMLFRNNKVTIAAGTSAGTSVVFNGQILNAWQELDSQPETSLVIDSQTSVDTAMQPAPPVSYSGPADVATIIAGIARRCGRGFRNNGVQAVLDSAYYPGTPYAQASAVARHANIEFYDDHSTYWIWPKLGVRSADAAPLISPASGLVRYPKYQQAGMNFSCLFNPSIMLGGRIVMQSSIVAANGTWYVNDLSYDLAAQVPGGPWFCDVGCYRLSGTPPARS